MSVEKRIEEIRNLLKRHLKLKEGAKKMKEAAIQLGVKSHEQAGNLIEQINKEMEDLRNEMYTLMAQVSPLYHANVDQPKVSSENSVSNETDINSAEDFEKIISHYKKQLNIEIQVKQGIKKLIEASEVCTNESSASDIVLLYQDSTIKIEYLRMLILMETQKKAHRCLSSELYNLQTSADAPADSDGYLLPRLIDLSAARSKAKVEAAYKMLAGAMEIKNVESSLKPQPHISYKGGNRSRSGIFSTNSIPSSTERSSDLMEFLKQLIVIYNRSFSKITKNPSMEASDDVKLLESYSKNAVMSGSLSIALHGVSDLDEEMIKDSKAVARDIDLQKGQTNASWESRFPSIILMINIDSNTLYKSPIKMASKTCFTGTQIELVILKNKVMEIILKSSVSNVMVAFSSLTLLEFLDCQVHKIKIPLEPTGFLYCSIQYVVPRPRQAKVLRQKRIFLKKNNFKRGDVPLNLESWAFMLKLAKQRETDKAIEGEETMTTSSTSTSLIDSLEKIGLIDDKVAQKSCSPSENHKRAIQILSGKFENESLKHKEKSEKMTIDCFRLIHVLGQGHFGKVLLAELLKNKAKCAIKSIPKIKIVESDDFEMINIEKSVFILATEFQHPFLVQLFGCFCCQEHICFVMEFVAGGDLMTHIHMKLFSESRSTFYAACVVLGLEFLHNNGVVYRDLKLDNLMMDNRGYVKIGDFGLCKSGIWFGDRTSTFCGTPEFIAPEVLEAPSYTRSVDWWALGVLIFEMLIGESPFPGEDENEIFESILYHDVVLPPYLSRNSCDIVLKLLCKVPDRRLGSCKDDGAAIKAHPFFKNINFDELLKKNIKPDFVPDFKKGDSTFIDKELISCKAAFTVPHKPLVGLTAKQERFFDKFYYSNIRN